MRAFLRNVSLFCFLILLIAVSAGTAEAVVVLFKDGFVIQGRVTVPKEWFADKVSGQTFSVPVSGAAYFIDDGVRKILFTPDQVHDILKDKLTGEQVNITKSAPKLRGTGLPLVWEVANLGEWDEHWERTVLLNVLRDRPSQEHLTQRVTMLTPKMIRVDALKVDWVPYYRTKEWEPGTIRKMLYQYYTTKKEPPVDRHLKIARFMMQAGWTDYAKRELDDLLKNYPQHKERASDIEAGLKRAQASEFMETLELASRAGRFGEMGRRLDDFAKDKDLAASLEPKETLRVQELKNSLESTQEQLTLAKECLQQVPQRVALVNRAKYVQAAMAMLQELTPETLPRLEKFIILADDQNRALKQKRQPKQDAETTMAFALTGWVLGGGAAEGNVAFGWELWETRQLLTAYQKTLNGYERAKSVSSLKHVGLAPDVVARIIKMLPPADPCDKLKSNPIQLKTEAPDQVRPAEYLVQVPPEYNHQRSCPVLLVLHRSGEQPADMINRWSELAAKHGYLLVAPSWGGGTYSYSAKEQAAVLDCLRDLRRRFQVDSDRVFLFGAEQGGAMAYDIGLGHPDLFAGVMVMSACPALYSVSYRANAQFLPFYVVDGEKHGKSPVNNRAQATNWKNRHYPVLYVEYRGRSGEWFETELPQMIDWANRKKRYHPTRQVGRRGDEEFVTMRPTDNHFYWLSTSAVHPRNVNSAVAWNGAVKPATLECTIYSGNQIYLRVSGVLQASVWLEPGVLDFSQKIKVQLNGVPAVGIPAMIQPNLETLLEEYYYTGDRQRLYLARIDVHMKG